MWKVYLSFLFCILLPFQAAATIYRWKDSQGIIHFSDQKHEGAEVIQLPETPNVSEPSAPPPPQFNPSPAPTKPQVIPYTISITSPANNDTVTPGERNSFSIAVNIATALSPEDTIQILVDNVVVQSGSAMSYSLPDLDRGQHTLLARVVTKATATSSSPNILSSSDKITIFVKQPSIILEPSEHRQTQQLSLTPNQMQRIREIMNSPS